MLVVALIAGAAISHATWNIVVKRAGTSGPGFIWSGMVVGAVVFAPFGIHSLLTSGTDLRQWLPWALVSGLLEVIYFLVLQRGYRLGDVSVVYPLARGTGPLLAVVLAIIVLQERPTVIELIGAGVVIAGVMVIGFAGDRDRRRSNPRSHGRQAASRLVGTGVRGPSAGVIYGLIVGVIIAIFTIWDASAITVGGMPPVGLYWGSVVFQMVLLAIPALRQRRATLAVARTHWVSVLLFGILAPPRTCSCSPPSSSPQSR